MNTRFVDQKLFKLRSNLYSRGIDLYDLGDEALEAMYVGRDYMDARRETNEQKHERGEYPFVPCSFYYVMQAITSSLGTLKKYDPINAIDVGCGWGNIVYMMGRIFGFDSTGIEIDAPSCEIARKTVGSYGKILNEDAFTLDYSPYNLVYLYCPLFIDSKMAELYTRIATTMKHGIIIEMLPHYFYLLKIDGLQISDKWYYGCIIEKIEDDKFAKIELQRG